MNNDIYKNLKENIIKKLQGKCYKSFGYISKIYKIEQILGNKVDLVIKDNIKPRIQPYIYQDLKPIYEKG